MKINDYLKDEIKRLNRRNDLLEKNLSSNNCNLAVEEMIQKNTLAMCEIAKAYFLNINDIQDY